MRSGGESWSLCPRATVFSLVNGSDSSLAPGRTSEDSMRVDLRSAIPAASPHNAPFRARRERLVSGIATGVTVFTAVIAVLVVATAAVVLALT
jgi:hypothetical protein